MFYADLRRVLTYFLLLSALYAAADQFRNMRAEVLSLRDKTCNVDKARVQFLSEVEYRFKLGCRVGIDYPPEYRQDQTGFNPHSPTNFCHDEYQKIQPAVEEGLGAIGQ